MHHMSKERCIVAAVVAVSALTINAALDVEVKGPFAERLSACVANHVEKAPADSYARIFTRHASTLEWQGEFWGKYMLSAVPLQRWSGSRKIADAITSSTAIIIGSQLDDGYIGNYAPGRRAAEGWDVWCCKYVLLGLLASHDFSGDRRTLDAAVRLGDYFLATFGPGRKSLRKTGNFCGLPSCSVLGAFVRLYERTHERRFLDFAKYIVSEMDAADGARIVSDAFGGVTAAKRNTGDPANPLSPATKSYEYMSCYQGLVDFARVTGERRYLEAAVKAAEDILRTEVFITGASSCGERWFGGAQRQTEPLMGLGETCVVTTWLRLCELLFGATGDPKWADAIECAYYNAFLASMRRDSSEFAQYTPLMGTRGPGNHHCRLHTNCCNANGPRGHLPILNCLATEGKDVISFNFYVSADIAARYANGHAGTFEMFSLYPRLNGFPPYWSGVCIRYASDTVDRVPVRLRIPAWSANTVVRLNGKAMEGVQAGTYFTLDREWRNGDDVEIVFDLSVKAHFLNGHVAFTSGPLTLARDTRFKDGDIGAPVRLTGANGLGNRDVAGLFHRVQAPTEDMKVVFAAILPVDLHHDNAFRSLPSVVNFCDYASAANTWDDSSACRVWLPAVSQPE